METNKLQTSKLFVYSAVDFKDEFEEVNYNWVAIGTFKSLHFCVWWHMCQMRLEQQQTINQRIV